MGKISTDFGSGGANLTPGESDQNDDSLGTILRDVADDLAALKPVTVTSPAATDLATAITLLNEIRTKTNTRAAITIKTIKD